MTGIETQRDRLLHVKTVCEQTFANHALAGDVVSALIKYMPLRCIKELKIAPFDITFLYRPFTYLSLLHGAACAELRRIDGVK